MPFSWEDSTCELYESLHREAFKHLLPADATSSKAPAPKHADSWSNGTLSSSGFERGNLNTVGRRSSVYASKKKKPAKTRVARATHDQSWYASGAASTSYRPFPLARMEALLSAGEGSTYYPGASSRSSVGGGPLTEVTFELNEVTDRPTVDAFASRVSTVENSTGRAQEEAEPSRLGKRKGRGKQAQKEAALRSALRRVRAQWSWVEGVAEQLGKDLLTCLDLVAAKHNLLEVCALEKQKADQVLTREESPPGHTPATTEAGATAVTTTTTREEVHRKVASIYWYSVFWVLTFCFTTLYCTGGAATCVRRSRRQDAHYEACPSAQHPGQQT